MIVDNKEGDINKFKIALSDLNNMFYGTSDLVINNIFLDSDKQLISVKKFTGKDKGMDFFSEDSFLKSYR